MAYGLLHRLDRDTSGVVLCAKSYLGYYLAQLHFEARRVRKVYVCLCQGWVQRRTAWFLEASLRAEGGRATVVAGGGAGARSARTEVQVVGHLLGSGRDASLSLLEVRLHTGRLHQIRAHLAHEGHPLVGDAAYGGGASHAWCPRIFLHSYGLSLRLALEGEEGAEVEEQAVDAHSPLPSDLRGALANLVAEDMPSRALLRRWIRGGRST